MSKNSMTVVSRIPEWGIMEEALYSDDAIWIDREPQQTNTDPVNTVTIVAHNNYANV